MTTLWEWNSTADSGWTSTVGTAPTNETAGSYGQRWTWAATTAQAYGYKSGFATANFGCRFIYRFTGMTTPTAVSFCVFQALSSGPANLFRVDITTSSFIRLRDAANATLATGTVALTAGTEYRFEVYRNGTTVTVKVYNLAGTLIDTISGTVTATNIERLYFGNNASITGNTLPTFTMDAIKVTDVGAEVGAPAGSSVANAGADVANIAAKATTTLDGSASSGSTFSWSLVDYTGDNPGTVTITNGSTKTASYTAPTTHNGCVLHFRITVDGTATDDVYHTVLPHKLWWLNGASWEPLYGEASAVTPIVGPGSVPAFPTGWTTLIESDYFDTGSLDTSKWWARDHKSLTPTNQKSVYLASKLSFQDGYLHINVDREDVTDGGTSYAWTSGGIQSDGLMQLPTDQEWCVEYRYKLNMVDGHSKGIWPAIWFRNAPSVGEIDGNEAWGSPQEPNTYGVDKAVFTLWQNTNGGGAKLATVFDCAWNAWHTDRIEYNPLTGQVKFYTDGVLKVTRTVADGAWLHGTEYSSSFYMRIEVQVSKAGAYYGEADDSLVKTNGHYEFLVDFIRAFTR